MKRFLSSVAANLIASATLHAVTIHGYLDISNSVVINQEKSASDALAISGTYAGVTGAVEVNASAVQTANSYSFTAEGETSLVGSPNFCDAYAMAGCTTDPAGHGVTGVHWAYVTPDLLSFQYNNPYTGLKKFVFTKPMRFTGSYSVSGGSRVPSFKGTIFSESGTLTWTRGNGTKSKQTAFGSEPLEIVTADQPYGYYESFIGTVAPGTYYVGAAAVWVSRGATDQGARKGSMSFRINFSPEPKIIGKANQIKGTVKVVRDGVRASLQEGDPIYVGDMVETDPKSFVKLGFEDQTMMTVGPNSAAKVEAFANKSPGVISLLKGFIRAEVEKQASKDGAAAKLIIKTSNGGMGVRGTEFEVSYGEKDGKATSTVDVTEGVVELIDYLRGDIRKISAGKSGSVVGPVKNAAPSLAPEIAVYDSKFKALSSGRSKVKWGKVPFKGGGRELTFKIKNIWTANLKDIALDITGEHASDFKIIAEPATMLKGGASSDFTVRFKPSASGPRTATLRIASNDEDENPFEIALVGNGVVGGPAIAVTRSAGSQLISLSSNPIFGSVKIGDPGRIKAFVLKNQGSSPLEVLSAKLRGAHPTDFQLVGTLPDEIKPGESVWLKVRFRPKTEGLRSAKLRITCGGADGKPVDVFLNGQGQTSQ